MNRREFLKMGAGGAMLAATGCVSSPESVSEKITKDKFAKLTTLPPMMPNAVVKESALTGKNACKFVDDCIWFLRDIARMKPKSIFDTPYLGGFKKIHDATGLKVQFNLFYRTDFFYGMDEFSLADMPATYKAEFQDNADWIKFGLHSLQEFPDYPWISADYKDAAKCLTMIRCEVARFAGDNMFARFLLPHWVPMSKDGVKALVDGGIKMMVVSRGNRFAWNGDSSVLPYGHDFRLMNNRKPETALYTRAHYMADLAASICGYNHITAEQQAEKDALFAELDRLQDPDSLAEDDTIAGVYSSYWKWLADYDILQAAEEITQPVLLLQGEEDYQVTLEDFGIWKEALGEKENWRLISYPGLTHAFVPGRKTEGSAVYLREAKVQDTVIRDISSFILGTMD